MRYTIIRYAKGLYQLSRLDPAASWAGGAFVIGAALAYYQVGTALLWQNGLLALVGVTSAISFGAHGINDTYDWLTGTDKESIGKGTGGSRVIPQGKFSVVETATVGVIGLTITFVIFVYLFLDYGWPILVLGTIAIGAPLTYSLPPFKFAYRPFAELIVVVPTLIGVTIGSELVLSGTITWTGGLAGCVHAAFSISWFVVSRLPDYEPDKRVGKTTTVVYLGRDTAPFIATVYLLCGVGLSVVGLVTFGWPFAVTPVFGAFMLVGLSRLDPDNPEQASTIRYRQMRLTTMHAVALALAIVILRMS
ncbi:prenyltransferase [Natronococcus wangiae]|uniref:prenyltransferase n=1 Tax=Natronococcus wangiae TaxID=3068275 RepID=UPI00273DEEED|nr:prenyltransferase [Natronococcus sp. AD5]